MTEQDQAAAPALLAAGRAVALSPVALGYAVNIGAAMLAGFGIHLTRDQTGAVLTITAGVVTVFTALFARPWHVAAIPGAATAILTACAAFGLKWTPEQIATGVAALSAVLGYLTQSAVVPAAAVHLGTTATELLLDPEPAPPPKPKPARRRPPQRRRRRTGRQPASDEQA